MKDSKSEPEKNQAVDGKDCWFGLYKELGKTEARQSFLHLLDDVKDEAITLAITDRGEKVAVIMGYKQFQILLSILKQQIVPSGKNPLAGLIDRVGDLSQGSAKVNALFQESLEKTAESL